ncbi:MAG: PEP-CTERM sorting domain-containing protein [Phycisphaerae bacterium]|jgi:hypothetical protein|nr:PEP-CTERM sorting domain-containing protein [Phycisphaerae bacterium]
MKKGPLLSMSVAHAQHDEQKRRSGAVNVRKLPFAAKTRGLHVVAACFMVMVMGLGQDTLHASVIDTPSIMALPSGMTGSGNGTVDLRMFTFSGSEIKNQVGSFNGDNGNNTLPNSGGAEVSLFDESYVTTAGELKAFYDLNFPTASIPEILLFLDISETGGGEPNNRLVKLDIILNPATIQGGPDASGDVSSDEQAAINQVYTGGTKIAYLDPEPADNLPVNSQGAGFADYAIFTGVDPYALADSDVLLFNISMDTLSNGSEEIFLSGTYGSIIPEPATMSLLAFGGLVALRRRRNR